MSNTLAEAPAMVRLTRDQLKAQLALMGDQIRVRIIDAGGGQYNGYYWKSRYNGYASSKDESGVYASGEAIDNTSGASVLFELVDLPTTEPATEPFETPVRLTQKQCSQHLEELASKMCRWVSTAFSQEGYYAKKPLGSGVTRNLEEAQVFQVATILEQHKNQPMVIELLDQATAKQISLIPVKLCVIEEALPLSLVEGLKLQPKNPVYRATILSRLGKMPPAEIVEYPALKDWIEYNCEVKAKASQDTRPIQAQVRPNNEFHIDLEFYDTESGRCRYSVSRYGSGQVALSVEDIENIMDDCETTNVDSLMRAIESDFEEDVYSVRGDMEWSDDGPEHENHSSDDFKDSNWEYAQSGERLRNQLVIFLRQNLSRERLERLGIAPE